MKAMQQYSSDARVFCLIHKMDLVPEDSGERVKKTIISPSSNVKYFPSQK